MSNIPPKTFERNEFGLLKDPPRPYIYNEDGTINWRKMIDPQFLVANKQKTKETDITKLEDKDLLILLGGIKDLAHIRGYSSVSYQNPTACPDYVMANCEIHWQGNYETNGLMVRFSSLADASPANCQGFGRSFLAATAENRSFVRCVRNFLRINIVGQDEIGNKETEEATENPTSPVGQLRDLMNSKGMTFEKLKEKLIAEEKPGAAEMNSLDDLPKSLIFELMARIKKKDKK